MIRLLIVEDQPVVRSGLHVRLNAEEDLSVIGEAPDCRSALNLAQHLIPDVLLIDGDMPFVNYSATSQALHEIDPGAMIVVLSFYENWMARAQRESPNIAAWVTKSIPADTLLATIRQVVQSKSDSIKEEMQNAPRRF